MVDICNEVWRTGWHTIFGQYGRSKAPYKGMKAYFKTSQKERLIMQIIRLALFAASVHQAEGENILSF